MRCILLATYTFGYESIEIILGTNGKRNQLKAEKLILYVRFGWTCCHHKFFSHLWTNIDGSTDFPLLVFQKFKFECIHS